MIAEAEVEDCCPVVELREYTLRQGARDTLVELFDRHFVEGQEQAGIAVIGQFRDLDRQDRFIWMRGFAGMAARRKVLGNFYGGPVWAEHKDAANATMIDSDNVLLLRPAFPGSGFDLESLTRAGVEAIGRQDADGSALLVCVHHIRPEATDDFARAFLGTVVPLMTRLDAPALALLLSEHARNDFTRLPVREGENVLVTIQQFSNRHELDRYRSTTAVDAAWKKTFASFDPLRSRPPEEFRLAPTSRSLLGAK